MRYEVKQFYLREITEGVVLPVGWEPLSGAGRYVHARRMLSEDEEIAETEKDAAREVRYLDARR